MLSCRSGVLRVRAASASPRFTPLKASVSSPLPSPLCVERYLNFYRTLDHNGTILWRYGKPLIAIRDSLWAEHTTARYIADLLNAQSTDRSSDAGYSVVAVQMWSTSAPQLLALIAQLQEHVLVVKLDELVQLAKDHIPAENRRTEVPVSARRDSG